jgi:hypothetical protein
MSLFAFPFLQPFEPVRFGAFRKFGQLVQDLETGTIKMKQLFARLIIIGPFALLVGSLCSCQTEEQKSPAEKEREAWYSNYVDNQDQVWSEHL